METPTQKLKKLFFGENCQLIDLNLVYFGMILENSSTDVENLKILGIQPTYILECWKACFYDFSCWVKHFVIWQMIQRDQNY